MANFFFYRYHFVLVDEPELFSEVETMYADSIRKLNLFVFKVDKKTGEQKSVQYENDILHCLDGVAMLQVRNNMYIFATLKYPESC